MSRKPFDSRNPDYVYSEVPPNLSGWIMVNFYNALLGSINREAYLIEKNAGGDDNFLKDAREQLTLFINLYPDAEALSKELSAPRNKG